MRQAVQRDSTLPPKQILLLTRELPQQGGDLWRQIKRLGEEAELTLVCVPRFEPVSLNQWREIENLVDRFVLHRPSLARRVISRFVGRVWSQAAGMLMDRQIDRNTELYTACQKQYCRVILLDESLQTLCERFDFKQQVIERPISGEILDSDAELISQAA